MIPVGWPRKGRSARAFLPALPVRCLHDQEASWIRKHLRQMAACCLALR